MQGRSASRLLVLHIWHYQPLHVTLALHILIGVAGDTLQLSKLMVLTAPR